MEEKEQNLPQASNKKGNTSLKQRVWGGIIVFFVVLLVVAELLLLYFADPLLRDALTEKVKEKSDGLYSIDFEKIRVNLGSMSFFLEGFELIPDTSLYNDFKKRGLDDKALYKINIQTIEINRIHILKYIFTGNLVFNSIVLQSPDVSLIGIPGKAETNNQKYDAIHTDLYPIIQKFSNSLTVKSIRIRNGYFNFYTSTSANNETSLVNGINIDLYDFYIDAENHTQKNRLFYADGIAIEFYNYKLLLNDSIHTLTAGKVTVDTKEGIISASNVFLKPDRITDSLNFSGNAYNVEMPGLIVEGFDVAEIYFQQIVHVENIKLLTPTLEVVRKKTVPLQNQNRRASPVTVHDFDLYNLIEGKLQQLAIDKFSLINANIKMNTFSTENKPAYDIGSITIELYNFMVDSATNSDKTKILYADDIDLIMNNYNMRLADNVHILHADQINIFTARNEIYAKRVSLKRDPESTAFAQAYYDISIESLLLNEADLHKAYSEREFFIEKLEINSPIVNIQTHAKARQNRNRQSSINLYALTKNYLEALLIGTISLNNGVFNIQNFEEGKQTAFSSGKMQLMLKDFVLDAKSAQSNKFFYANGLDITLSDYSMKVADNFHQLSVENFHLSTLTSEMMIENVSYHPFLGNLSPQQLILFRQAQIIDLHIKKLHLVNADIHRAYFDNRLHIDSISISNPELKIVQYPQIDSIVNSIEQLGNFQTFYISHPDSVSITNDWIDFFIHKLDSLTLDAIIASKIVGDTLKKEGKMKPNEFYELIGKYLDVIDVNKLYLSGGNISFTTKDTLNNEQMYFGNSYRILLKQFYFNIDTLVNEHKLFSKDIDIKMTNNLCRLPDRVHSIKAAEIKFSTNSATLYARDLLFSANKAAADSLKKVSYFDVFVPDLYINKISLDRAYNEQMAQVASITLSNPDISFFYRKEFEQFHEEKTAVAPVFPKFLSGININEAAVTNGRLRVFNQFDSVQHNIASTFFDFNSNNFFIDSTFFYSGQILFPKGTYSLVLRDFQMKLPDSLQYLEAEELTISTKDSILSGENFLFTYNKDVNVKQMLMENNKANAFHIEIPEFQISGIDFQNVYEKRELLIDTFVLQMPNFEILTFAQLKKTTTDFSKETDLYKYIQPYLNVLNVNRLLLNNGSFATETVMPDTTKKFAVENLNVELLNLNVDSLSFQKENTIFCSEDIIFRLKNYNILLKDSLYGIKLKEVGISLANSQIWIDTLLYYPRLNFRRYDDLAGRPVGVSRFWFKRIDVIGFDIFNFLETKIVDIDTLLIDSMHLHVEKELLLKPEPRYRKMPLDQFMALSSVLNIDNLMLQNSNFTYNEYQNKTRKAGRFVISNMNVHLHNVTNDTLRLAQNPQIFGNASMAIMGSAKFTAKVAFFPYNQNGKFSIDGEVGKMPITDLNPFLENTSLVSIREGQLQKMKFKINGDNVFATGRLWARYKNLSIDVLVADTINNSLSNRGFLSAVANGVLRSDNPKWGRPLKPGYIYFERDTTKAIFHYWIQSLLSGLKSTIGINSREIKQMRRENKRQMKLERKMEKLEQREEKREKRAENRWLKKREKEKRKQERLLEKQLNRERRNNI